MNIRTYLNIDNKKLRRARKIALIFCLILGLVSAMILAYYHSVDLMYQFDLGYALLRLSVFFFVCVIACSTAFDKFFYTD